MFILGTVYYVYLLLQNGKTALMWASEGGHIKCVDALLRGGANTFLNHQDKVSSPKAVRYLLRYSEWYIVVHQTFSWSTSCHEVEQLNV